MFDNWEWENNRSSSDERTIGLNEKSSEMLEAKSESWNITFDETFALKHRTLDFSGAGTVKLKKRKNK